MKSLEQATKAVQQLNIIRHIIKDDGRFPNNSLLPLLVFQQAIADPDAEIVEEIFESNMWINPWRDGVFDYHHYHSTAHEVLGVIRGVARIQFGGPEGVTLQVEAGDVVIIPAGVAHKCVEADEFFQVVGAYPEGQEYDLMKGEDGERARAQENIKRVPLPADPLYGTDGPLVKNWNPTWAG
ncbi:MAG TPA: cupin domain-containing protein [Chryseosolibacter sp.]|nr:cupin domain-containing protein [Chryseosolibacter sp.]